MLVTDLDADLARLRPEQERRPGRSRDVWHCTLRAHPDSAPLSDARWEDAVRRVLAATGIAPGHDPMACRWIALRVDSHEVRIIAPLARRDGLPPRVDRDTSRAMAACQLLDRDTGPGAGRRSGATASSSSPPDARLQQSGPPHPWAAPATAHPGRRPR
ncbi:hypothetical protein [Kitasatospora sp. NPDC057015]|uniref:hypothetical protein n=1 Tax=Kitasatospora sp. NPDC057015 TaxID=3346001 RepID=UPI003629DCD8